MGLEADAEEVAEFAVEVGPMALRMGQHADGQIRQPRQAFGEHAQGDTFSGAGVTLDQGEPTLAHQGLFDPPAEVLQFWRDEQRLERKFRGEGVPLQAIQGQPLVVHGDFLGQ